MVMFQPQQKITRPMGNAQARNTPLGAAPAFGNTTNVNGAQTASQSPFNLGFMPKGQMISPAGMQAAGAVPPVVSQSMVGIGGPAAPPAQPASPAIQPQYPGGDVAGLATYYRNTAQQNYNPQAVEAQTREANRNAQYMGAEPVAGSSLASAQINARRPADLLNPVTARVGNAYDGMVGFASDPNRYNPADPGIQARQQGNAQRVASGQLMDRGNNRFMSGSLNDYATTGMTWQEREKKAEFDAAAPDRARAQQVMMQKRGEREAARAADPAANENRLASIHRASVARANKHQEFMDANGGLNYRQADRLEKKRQSIERRAQRGDISRDEAQKQTQAAVDTALRRGTGMTGIDRRRELPLAINEMPKRGNLATQPPEVAAESVKTMTDKSPILKSMGVTPDTDLSTLHTSVASMDLSQMTSTQKFEAARHLHEFMLSQMESGNPAYQIGEGESVGQSGDDPRVSLIGLSGLKPGNKAQMVQWLEDLHRQANRSGKPRNASPMGIMPPGARIAG